jgi:uracil-DNA glycosylase
MTLQLDARQRAMLAEMGVRVYEPPTRSAPPVAEPPSVRHPGPREQAPQSPEAAAVSSPATVRESRNPASTGGPRNAAIELMQWDALTGAAAECRACPLGGGRRNAILGAGDLRAEWLVVGDPPREDEDQQGEPFVGEAGQLLDNMLKALGLNRQQQVYLTNVVKCRPVGRNPEPPELAQCDTFLRRQVQLLQPRIILAMGRFAVQALLGTGEPIGKLRGRIHRYQGVPVVATYHPSYLLRHLADKAKAWEDLCLALDEMRRQPG